MNVSNSSTGATAEDLCLACGLCCNGVIFARVQLQPGDNAAQLRALGLPLVGARRDPRAEAPSSAPVSIRFPQPCAAFDGCRCRIYAERPVYCRQFECLVLKSVKAGRTERATALGMIRAARERAEAVRRLLQTLGDTDEGLALSARFRRTARRLENAELDEETAAAYGELTLAVHSLNCLLSEAFYPGNAPATSRR